MDAIRKAKLQLGMVDTARENLAAMPAPPRDTKVVSLREAIRTLTPTIATLIKRGYSRDGILALLREQGIDCSPATFRSVYRAPKGKRRGATKVTGSAKTQSAPPAPPVHPVAAARDLLQSSPIAAGGTPAEAVGSQTGIPTGVRPSASGKG